MDDIECDRGRAFQIECGLALERCYGRQFDNEVALDIGSGKLHSYDLATAYLDVVAECKAFKFAAAENNPSAKSLPSGKLRYICARFR
jgi:hypothetical protein